MRSGLVDILYCVSLLLCCSFFFFKQKTAYEMRISDWSSDVCSSDLLAPALTTWLAGHIHTKWLMLAVLNVGFFLLAAVMDEVAIMVILGPMLVAIAHQYGEIGRAHV